MFREVGVMSCLHLRQIYVDARELHLALFSVLPFLTIIPFLVKPHDPISPLEVSTQHLYLRSLDDRLH